MTTWQMQSHYLGHSVQTITVRTLVLLKNVLRLPTLEIHQLFPFGTNGPHHRFRVRFLSVRQEAQSTRYWTFIRALISTSVACLFRSRAMTIPRMEMARVVYPSCR